MQHTHTYVQYAHTHAHSHTHAGMQGTLTATYLIVHLRRGRETDVEALAEEHELIFGGLCVDGGLRVGRARATSRGHEPSRYISV
jgi:hypothetical protein